MAPQRQLAVVAVTLLVVSGCTTASALPYGTPPSLYPLLALQMALGPLSGWVRYWLSGDSMTTRSQPFWFVLECLGIWGVPFLFWLRRYSSGLLGLATLLWFVFGFFFTFGE